MDGTLRNSGAATGRIRMVSVVVVVLAPQSDPDRLRELEERVSGRLRGRKLRAVCTLFAPTAARREARHLALAWAHDSLVDWGAACRTYVYNADVDRLHLFEISDASTHPLHLRQEQSQEGSFRAVANGFFVSSVVPYGMAPLSTSAETRLTNRTRIRARRVLRPGRPDEIEVVRLIYEMFVHEGRSRTEILNFLNAEGVPAPRRIPAWRPRHIDLILTDPVYVGASRVGRVVAFDIGIPIISPALYHLAQAKLFDHSGASGSAPGRWSHHGANDHRVTRSVATALRTRHDPPPPHTARGVDTHE
jgi:Recombinase